MDGGIEIPASSRADMDLHALFRLCGLPSREPIKLYRHTAEKLKQVASADDIDLFQAAQTSPQLGSGYVAFFAGEGSRMARFTGMRRVLSVAHGSQASGRQFELARRKNYMGPDLYWHDLEVVSAFEALTGRLLIVWPEGRLHHRWLLEKPAAQPRAIPVHAIMPAGFAGVFPGFSNLVLSHERLAELEKVGDGGSGWIAALQSTKGVYLITHIPTGDLYVGSATGTEGIWGRWRSYARTVHGGNKVLVQKAQDDGFKRDLQFSILETMSNLANDEAGRAAEKLWKKKLGQKAIVLNDN